MDFTCALTQQATGTFLLSQDHVISGLFVFLQLSNVPRHHQSWLMDADGGSV